MGFQDPRVLDPGPPDNVKPNESPPSSMRIALTRALPHLVVMNAGPKETLHPRSSKLCVRLGVIGESVSFKGSSGLFSVLLFSFCFDFAISFHFDQSFCLSSLLLRIVTLT